MVARASAGAANAPPTPPLTESDARSETRNDDTEARDPRAEPVAPTTPPAEADARSDATTNPDIAPASSPAARNDTTRHPMRPAWAGWAALGGAAVAVAGVIPAVMSVSTRADLDARCDAARVCPLDAQAIADRGASQSLAADVLFASGGALALGFGLVWLLGGTTGESTPNVSAWCDGQGCNMSARGHF
jgi:hypothetical protein